MINELLTSIRLAAFTTQDPVTKKLLLGAIDEDEKTALSGLYSSEWSNVFTPKQEIQVIKTSLLKGVLLSFK